MRELTKNERAVLEDVVLDADVWWTHAKENFKGDAEAALAGKIARHQPVYEAKKAKGGYQKRALREAE